MMVLCYMCIFRPKDISFTKIIFFLHPLKCLKKPFVHLIKGSLVYPVHNLKNSIRFLCTKIFTSLLMEI